jgi:ferrochelatase
MSDARNIIGLLLVNVGTPDAPNTSAVRRYLREFLSDPRVLDLHPVARWMLLNLVILPFRPRTSAAAYQQIWTDAGSPLLVNSQAFAAGLQRELGDGFAVEVAMRYGNPSIASALERLRERGVERHIVFPLYPQHASSSTGTSLEEIFRQLGERWNVADVTTVAPFYADDGFIAAAAERASPIVDELRPDHHLFSFHGLPERHVLKSDETGGHCLQSADCCREITESNKYCYRAQCYATARLVAASMGLSEGSWSVAFQSRLGRTPWIHPYTDEVLPVLARERGIRRLAVHCSAFVADCLETLEEIGIRARADFIAAGGEELRLVPAVNDSQRWIRAAADMVRRVSPRG